MRTSEDDLSTKTTVHVIKISPSTTNLKSNLRGAVGLQISTTPTVPSHELPD